MNTTRMRLPARPDIRQYLLGWIGRAIQVVALAGLLAFGAYIVLRATGATPGNFEQWRVLVDGLPMQSAQVWVANLGIGLHFAMGTILVLAWPILLSSRIRARHRAVHRWTGRVYVTAGVLAGVGGLSFILTHGAYTRAASIAFAVWGAVMMLCATMAFVHARAKRFDRHRAWAIRLFAMVLGSWVFDLEIRAWKDLTGGVGMGAGNTSGPFDYAILYLFFVPNLLVAECFIRNLHRRITLPRRLAWPAVAGFALAGGLFAYAVVTVTATPSGKYGKHLLQAFGGG
ncbi:MULTISPECIES: DUF2306 domain-containing protein [unclassified Pseudoxanthomonas]|uniref:DUF2306 domain-containing protein n=1 Tax=unclassified Pseudoxanthomonas TaxID=2645906 RepID=UPI0008E238BF|nr:MULTISPECIES: DUF2306 domain-containing protein [unclassified Pseudoxanthomonas]PPJ44146.1 DUF2306 domain-containing protein [Pseudoxanthomonas sp. KAs_5_3]SFV33629.1 Predicted membrane protein [Pseudoxanthomonas sp. YR558]